MKTEKPCKNCPFKRGNEWGRGSSDKIFALEQLDEAFVSTGKDIFSCHMKHPFNNIFSLQRMKEDDCAGYKMMKENMNKVFTHPDVVNELNETEPASFDLKAWAKNAKYNSRLNLV